MGSRESRPRLSQVAPVKSQDEDSEDRRPGGPGPQWSLPPLPTLAEQRTAGQRRRLPPLTGTETTLSTPSGRDLKSVEFNNRSIIHSHPPKKPQILQPMAFPIGHTNTVTTNAMVRERRGGAIQRYSTPRGQEHHRGIGHTQEGFLRAQGALHQQAYQRRRAHHRQAWEHRGSRHVYTSDAGDPSREGGRLVRRPTERDIFWG